MQIGLNFLTMQIDGGERKRLFTPGSAQFPRQHSANQLLVWKLVSVLFLANKAKMSKHRLATRPQIIHGLIILGLN